MRWLQLPTGRFINLAHITEMSPDCMTLYVDAQENSTSYCGDPDGVQQATICLEPQDAAALQRYMLTSDEVRKLYALPGVTR